MDRRVPRKLSRHQLPPQRMDRRSKRSRRSRQDPQYTTDDRGRDDGGLELPRWRERGRSVDLRVDG